MVLSPEIKSLLLSQINLEGVGLSKLHDHSLELLAVALEILKESKGRLREKHLVGLLNQFYPNHPHFVYLRSLPRHQGYHGPLLGPCVKKVLKNHSEINTYKIGGARFYEIKTV